jgi:hypothetical protein
MPEKRRVLNWAEYGDPTFASTVPPSPSAFAQKLAESELLRAEDDCPIRGPLGPEIGQNFGKLFFCGEKVF